MSSFQSDSDNSLFADEIFDNDWMDQINDDYNFDNDDYDFDNDFCNFEDDARHTQIRDAIMGKNLSDLSDVPKSSIPVDYSIQLAMNSKSESSETSDSSNLVIDDSLRMYLAAPSLVQRISGKNKISLSIDPNVDESESNPLWTPDLFVGNIPPTIKPSLIKNWFNDRGYGVSHVTYTSGSRYCFVRFNSIAIAKDVLYESGTNPSSFKFEGLQLSIKRPTRSNKKQSTNSATSSLNIFNQSTNSRFSITDIYYGTLITGAAMNNINRTNNAGVNNHSFGIFAQPLINNDLKISFHFHIDTNTKKLSILGTFNVHETSMLGASTTIKFEWSFQDLKGRKIMPVLINQNEIYLLLEITRSPIILDTEYTQFGRYDSFNEARLPGNVFIGNANVWLFKLSAEESRSDYTTLFSILYRHNLSPRRFSDDIIAHLMRSADSIRRNFDSIQLISNDEWIEENKEKVKQFFKYRWPSYPFETKFEIMKLLSKHVITVYDLIVDERAEEILKLCTINTLVALTDQIVNLAPRWFGSICDYQSEDWNEQEIMTEPEEDSMISTVKHASINTNDFPNLRSSATGKLINNGDTENLPMKTYNLKLSSHHLGTFSRLLQSAFDQLIKTHQLCLLESSGIWATKLELRTQHAHSFLIRKIYITPSTIFYEGPYWEEKCAVTRHYEQYQDRFLRVTFRDEDYTVLHDKNDNMSRIYERIKTILNNGVNICDRNYQFLAFSSSQLREHSCWMFAAPDAKTTVDTIRQWMGDFSKIHPVAKYAARLGQLFSTSIKGLPLRSDQYKEILDCEKAQIINERSKNYCFTDGIGIISKRLAKKLAQEIKLSDGRFYPSAFQIRCGGYKGMVCIDVFNYIKEPNIDLYFRPSMNKFPTDNLSIDVVRTSYNPTIAFLNRQIIILLTALGIPKKNFIDLQNHMLQQLSILTEDPYKAIQALKDLNELGGNGYHKFLIKYIQRLGKYKDPFVWRLLHVIKAFLTKELRMKTRIRVQDSWSLLGVIDESETLKYGQVFIQIDTTHQQKENSIKEIFQGPVIVTRNPCFHPGDIRKLEAVDLPAFHSFKNVIVFPKTGLRPHPQEMSGGDLDGDIYWISRHPKLIFSRDNEQPFDYQGQADDAKQTKSSTNTPYTIKDICNFFGEYIASDNLGMIANSHLALADQSPQGVMNDKCLELARMHSMAVDFAKNGVSAPRLKRDFRPTEYPSYMEKKDKTSYVSETVLGQLHEQVKSKQIDLCINETEEINITASFPYKIFFVNGSNEYMEEANVIKYEYDRDVKRIMRQYGIRHEVELVSGYILEFTSKQYIRETKLFDLRNDIKHAYRTIQDRYLTHFWQIFYQLIDESENEEQLNWSKISSKLTWNNQMDLLEHYVKNPAYDEIEKKASAWFRVTYKPWIAHTKMKQKNQTKTIFRGLFSFAWLVYPVLLRIFQQNEDTLNNSKRCLKRKRKTTSTKKNTQKKKNGPD